MELHKLETLWVRCMYRPWKTVLLVIGVALIFVVVTWLRGFLDQSGVIVAQDWYSTDALPSVSATLPAITDAGKGAAIMATSRQSAASNLLDEDAISVRLCRAQAYLIGGNASGRETALQSFRTIAGQLVPRTRAQLDQNLLTAAERAYRARHSDDALRYYRALFADSTTECATP